MLHVLCSNFMGPPKDPQSWSTIVAGGFQPICGCDIEAHHARKRVLCCCLDWQNVSAGGRHCDGTWSVHADEHRECDEGEVQGQLSGEGDSDDQEAVRPGEQTRSGRHLVRLSSALLQGFMAFEDDPERQSMLRWKHLGRFVGRCPRPWPHASVHGPSASQGNSF